uniref:Uncharacterized protein n=1 Tax=Anguilla anguilla TaxID=7936 RepID=A0A0E9TEB6_ANGAN
MLAIAGSNTMLRELSLQIPGCRFISQERNAHCTLQQGT